MEIREAELIFEAGKEAVVKALLEMNARIESLMQQVGILEKKITTLLQQLVQTSVNRWSRRDQAQEEKIPPLPGRSERT